MVGKIEHVRENKLIFSSGEYECFCMKKDETIAEMNIKFPSTLFPYAPVGTPPASR